jgi:hypothetical protein
MSKKSTDLIFFWLFFPYVGTLPCPYINYSTCLTQISAKTKISLLKSDVVGYNI